MSAKVAAIVVFAFVLLFGAALMLLRVFERGDTDKKFVGAQFVQTPVQTREA